MELNRVEDVGVRRRAELRGLKALARSQIHIGVWTMRLFAVSYLLLSFASLFAGDARAFSKFSLFFSLLGLASLRFERGSRSEAIGMGLLFIAGFVQSLQVRQGNLTGILIGAAGAIGI